MRYKYSFFLLRMAAMSLSLISLSRAAEYDYLKPQESTIAQNDAGTFYVSNYGQTISELLSDPLDAERVLLNCDYDASSLGNIVKLYPFAGGFVIYTSAKNLVHWTPKNSSVFATNWEVKDIAVIGNDVYILSPDGNLTRKPVNSQGNEVLVKDNSLVGVTRMVAVGKNLVIIEDNRNLSLIDTKNMIKKYISPRWDPQGDLHALNDGEVIFVGPNNVVYVKNIITDAKAKNLGAFIPGMVVDAHHKLYKAGHTVLIKHNPVGAFNTKVPNKPNQSYSIEVCKVSIGVLLGSGSAIPGVYHVFVRSVAGKTLTHLNFGPKDGYTEGLLAGTPFAPQVTGENYPRADCVTVFETTDPKKYAKAWSIVENYFKEAATHYMYQLYGYQGKNCSLVAQEAIEEAGLEFPFPNINGGTHVNDVIRGFGTINTPEDLANTIGSTVKVVTGLAIQDPRCCIQ